MSKAAEPIKEKIDANAEKLDAIDSKVDAAATHRVEIAASVSEHIDETARASAAAAVAAAVALAKQTQEAAALVGARLDRHESALEKLGEAVAGVNTSVKGLLDSVLGLQRAQLRMLGVSSLIGGCLIFAMSRALGL